ncbi:hypothetical protein BDA99DRAFT_543863 [Phascolomyces articulosus]|uniref:Uncharacterized protein n=1 Tax=Phascolomyces articulosus TaxID=60185 RepID=A0AAD5JZW9_9FUNG|nr:hypothetical protein BDA99DRAFT_543863 [Phascolomyces articulosus]
MVEYNTNNNINITKKPSTLQKLARWQSSTTHEKRLNTKPKSLASLEPVHHDDLKKGSLYIVKINHVSITLFEGSEAVPLRWSEARFLPGDFESFDAFDDAGNPPVHLWTRYLQVDVPDNWFALFEEARRKQREWKGINQRKSQLLPPLSTTSPLPSTQQQHQHTLLTDDHQRIIRDYALQSSSIPVSSSAAASTNIVDPTSSFLSSVSSLPMESRPLGYIMNYNDSSDIHPDINNNDNNDDNAPISSTAVSHHIEFPRPPSTVPGVLDRDELRRHLQDDLDNLQGSPSMLSSSSQTIQDEGRRPSSMSLSLETKYQNNNNKKNDKNRFLRHHASFTLSNSKRQSIQNFFSKK